MKPYTSTVGLPQYGKALRRRLPMPLYRLSYTFSLIVTPPGTVRDPLMRDGILPPREPRAAFLPEIWAGSGIETQARSIARRRWRNGSLGKAIAWCVARKQMGWL
jgi:hypothetical protein